MARLIVGFIFVAVLVFLTYLTFPAITYPFLSLSNASVESEIIKRLNATSKTRPFSDEETRGSRHTAFQDMDMQHRLAFVEKNCAVYKTWKNRTMEVFPEVDTFNDNNTHLIACNNHKVGSSSISYIYENLYKLHHFRAPKKQFRRKFLRHFRSPEFLNFSNSTKFMFIREPMDRLLSGYLEMVSTRKAKGRTFKEIMEDLVNKPYDKYNNYFRRQFDVCQPCRVHYQVIGTLNTFTDDMKLVLDEDEETHVGLGVHKNERSGKINPMQYFSTLPKKLIQQLLKIYEADFFIFGFPYPSHLT